MIDILFLLVACASVFAFCFNLVTGRKDAAFEANLCLCSVLVVGAFYYGVTGRVGFEWAL